LFNKVGSLLIVSQILEALIARLGALIGISDAISAVSTSRWLLLAKEAPKIKIFSYSILAVKVYNMAKSAICWASCNCIITCLVVI
jgi:hypothetical protein